MDKQLVRRSKRVSWLLRHGAAEQGLNMDAAGWISVADVLRTLRMSERELDDVVGQNDKQRFERVGDRIRACQGHSAAIVTLDAMEASWAEHVGDEVIFHGTSVESALLIAKSGITAQARSHVHLAPSRTSKVGKRWNVELLLCVAPGRVRAANIKLFESGNGVILARQIPAHCVVDVEAISNAAKLRVHNVRAAFGLDPAD